MGRRSVRRIFVWRRAKDRDHSDPEDTIRPVGKNPCLEAKGSSQDPPLLAWQPAGVAVTRGEDLEIQWAVRVSISPPWD